MHAAAAKNLPTHFVTDVTDARDSEKSPPYLIVLRKAEK